MNEASFETRIAALEKDMAEIKAELNRVPRLHNVDALAEELLCSAIEDACKSEQNL